MKNIFYYEQMQKQLDELSCLPSKPTLLLHSCCAPCSSSVIELLTEYFDITVYYYNPNIYPSDEYAKRSEEQKKICKEYFSEFSIDVICAKYDFDEFCNVVRGMETIPEGSKRCMACFELRLGKTAEEASIRQFDYFTSTLSVSPLKNVEALNKIGIAMGEKYGVKFLCNDFKKKNGYKRSCEISKELGIYRQDWCGCIYSMRERIIKSAKGYIFDLDGTLADTMTFYETFAYKLVKYFGGIPDDNIRDKVRLMTTEEAVVFLTEEYNLDASPDELLQRAYEIFEDFYGKEAKLKQGVREFLDYAEKNGKKLCIASATTRKYIELILESNDVLDKFEFILSGPDLNMSKNTPDLFYKAAHDMGLDIDDIVIFEDAHHAIRVAKEGDMKVIAVYDENATQFEDVIRAYSDIYINSMDELIFEYLHR